jgi:hypothetical protein
MTSVRRLVELAAQDTLARADVPLVAPVKIAPIAQALSLRVEDRAMEETGRLYAHGTWAEVILNSDQPPERRRFTFAHEAAHWLLHGPTLTHSQRLDLRGSYESEEYLCDKLAAALLMPRQWVMRFQYNPRSLATLYTVANEAEVSLSAGLVRLRDVLGWRLTLYQWTKDDGRWVLDGEAGLLPQQQGLLRTTEATRCELARIASEPDGISVKGLPVSLGPEEDDVPGEVAVNRGTKRAIALLQLPDRGFIASRSRSRMAIPRVAWTTA